MEDLPHCGFEVITSLRSDGLLVSKDSPSESQFYLLSRHRDRMLAAVTAFHWPEGLVPDLSEFKQKLHDHLNAQNGNCDISPMKLRATLSSVGVFKVTSSSIAATSLACLFPRSLSEQYLPPHPEISPTFRIFVSCNTTTVTPFTSHKTTHRIQYDEIRSLIPSSSRTSNGEIATLPAEILLVNPKGEIMEGSITTPYFYRKNLWITPASTCGGNIGTTRAYALDRGLCKEGIITKESVKPGERVVLSNGARGFGWGTIEKLETR